ncbi:MAG: hypothetical protein KC584_14930, partial [Nitrospira sp.]|nr:hypothetical protein [Nitrospira sp.]
GGLFREDRCESTGFYCFANMHHFETSACFTDCLPCLIIPWFGMAKATEPPFFAEAMAYVTNLDEN